MAIPSTHGGTRDCQPTDVRISGAPSPLPPIAGYRRRHPFFCVYSGKERGNPVPLVMGEKSFPVRLLPPWSCYVRRRMHPPCLAGLDQKECRRKAYGACLPNRGDRGECPSVPGQRRVNTRDLPAQLHAFRNQPQGNRLRPGIVIPAVGRLRKLPFNHFLHMSRPAEGSWLPAVSEACRGLRRKQVAPFRGGRWVVRVP